MIPGWGIGAIEIVLYLFISFILKQLPTFRDMNKISYYWLCMTMLTGFWELSYIINYDEIEEAMSLIKDNIDDNQLTLNQKKGRLIYMKLNKQNSHKMKPIPVCKIPEKFL